VCIIRRACCVALGAALLLSLARGVRGLEAHPITLTCAAANAHAFAETECAIRAPMIAYKLCFGVQRNWRAQQFAVMYLKVTPRAEGNPGQVGDMDAADLAVPWNAQYVDSF
jgi:hypothetical protein